MKILIADDHPVVRWGLKGIIESHAAMSVVAQAKDGEEAVELARRLDWDVAVVDYDMPGRAGIDLVKEIKRCHRNRPVLVLSWHPEELQGVQVIRSGASGYLNKENVADELLHAIEKVATGGKYISPKIAERLTDDIAQGGATRVYEALTDRERQVLRLMASGRRLNEISTELFISPSSVSTYRRRLFRKLSFKNNNDLIHSFTMRSSTRLSVTA